MKKLKVLWALFQAGKVVSDPAKWKRRQIGASAITTFLWAILEAARAYGYDIALPEEAVNSAAIALLAVVNFVFTITTTEKLGLSSRDNADS
jgi:hypothetical protein